MSDILGSGPAFEKTGRAGNGKLDSTLLKGLLILTELNESDEPMGISTLDAKLGLGKSNIHRLLNGLIRLGYVDQEKSTKRYMPTLRSWEVGSHVVERDHLMRTGQSVLQDLLQKTRETAFLCVLSGTDLVYLNCIQDNRTKASSINVGNRTPTLDSAAGIALLAHQPDPAGMLSRILSTDTSGKVRSGERYKEQFERVLRDGFAADSGGGYAESPTVAVVVPRANNPPIAAIGLELTPGTYTRQQLKPLVVALRAAAQTISSRLGVETEAPQLFAA